MSAINKVGSLYITRKALLHRCNMTQRFRTNVFPHCLMPLIDKTFRRCRNYETLEKNTQGQYGHELAAVPALRFPNLLPLLPNQWEISWPGTAAHSTQQNRVVVDATSWCMNDSSSTYKLWYTVTFHSRFSLLSSLTDELKWIPVAEVMVGNDLQQLPVLCFTKLFYR